MLVYLVCNDEQIEAQTGKFNFGMHNNSTKSRTIIFNYLACLKIIVCMFVLLIILVYIVHEVNCACRAFTHVFILHMTFYQRRSDDQFVGLGW